MKDESILLTIIVSAYNVDLYIDKCIKSILEQSYKNIEILIIDDGSTDNTGEICDKLAEYDSRIRIIHKKNEGLVIARKTGIELARGEIVAFVDGDDWIEKEMYSSMIENYKSMRKPDMVTSGLLYEFSSGKIDSIYDDVEERLYEQEEILKYIMPFLVNNGERCKNQILTSVCNKIFKKDLLYHIMKKVDSELTLGEDGAVIFFYLAKAKTISVIHQAWYHYIQHDDSMIRSYNFDSFKQVYKLKRCIEKGMKEFGIFNVVDLQIDYYVRAFLCNIIKYFYGDVWKVEYFFPSFGFSSDTKIILYGSGKVGYSYWKYILYSKCVRLIAWVDKNYERKSQQNPYIEPITVMMKKNFDYIIIAIENQQLAEEIKEEIVSVGIERSKVVWKPTKKLI